MTEDGLTYLLLDLKMLLKEGKTGSALQLVESWLESIETERKLQQEVRDADEQKI